MDSQKETAYERTSRLAESMFREFRDGDLPQTLRRDLRETYDFYLDSETRDRLSTMHPIKRWFVSSYLLVKNLVGKLTPVRRILIIIALILAADGVNGDTGNLFLAFLSVLFILGLELKDKLMVKDELAAGKAVQIALTPEESPDFPGWDVWLFTMPATEVGGDLVDYQVIENRLAVSLGDVAGKGLPASLFMAKLQATLRAVAPSCRSLAELGARTNEIFCRDGIPGKFASLIYVEVEPNEGCVRVLNAGHQPALLVRTEGVDEMERGAPALGLSAAARYREEEVDLEEGDLIVLYSDGVTEARDGYGSFFGDNRLGRLLKNAHGRSPQDVGERILEAVAGFVDGARASDDLSVAILSRSRSRQLPEVTGLEEIDES